MLMLEGAFGLVLAIIYSFIDNPINNIIDFFHNKPKIQFIYLIICLILYIIISAGRNSYKFLTIRIYSPMTKAIADSFLDPLIILYYFIMEYDFKSNGSINIIYFILNLVLSIINVLSGCVYSELLVIYLFNLEKDTHYEVSKRAKEIEKIDDDIELISS